MLESRELTKKFGAKTAVDQVSVVMEPGHVYAMLGPNGSGKTTLIKLANGLLTPTDGEITICGYKPGQEMGALLNRLLEHVLDHPEDNRKDILLELAKEG